MLTKISQKHTNLMKKKKKSLYNKGITEIEHGSFTPLVMSGTEGMGGECKKFYSPLVEMFRSRISTDCNVTVAWIKRQIRFSLITLIGICLRDSRSIFSSNSLEQSLSGDVTSVNLF